MAFINSSFFLALGPWLLINNRTLVLLPILVQKPRVKSDYWKFHINPCILLTSQVWGCTSLSIYSDQWHPKTYQRSSLIALSGKSRYFSYDERDFPPKNWCFVSRKIHLRMCANVSYFFFIKVFSFSSQRYWRNTWDSWTVK